jgi:DNA-binding transcriptional LysR family regulator
MVATDQDEIAQHTAHPDLHTDLTDELQDQMVDQEVDIAIDQQDQQETDQHTAHRDQVMVAIDQDEIVLRMVVVLDRHAHRDLNADHMIDSFD